MMLTPCSLLLQGHAGNLENSKDSNSFSCGRKEEHCPRVQRILVLHQALSPTSCVTTSKSLRSLWASVSTSKTRVMIPKAVVRTKRAGRWKCVKCMILWKCYNFPLLLYIWDIRRLCWKLFLFLTILCCSNHPLMASKTTVKYSVSYSKAPTSKRPQA